MNTLKPLVLILCLASVAHSQTVLYLQDCYDRAELNYPVTRQLDLIERTKFLSVKNASRASLPYVSVGGQATYQSEVTQIPFDVPGVEPLSNDQYRVFGEISKILYHGGMVNQQKNSEELTGDVEQQKVAVELYELKNRINELYFGILLMQEQASQSRLVKQDLQAALKKTEAGIANGTALKSAADVIRVELLRVDQRLINIESAGRTYRDMLGVFINQPIDEQVRIAKPSFTLTSGFVQRPELKLLETQKKRVQANYAMQLAGKKPRIELFLQGGYGRPGLNMLENNFSFYGLGGVRFSWLLSGYYTSSVQKEIATLRQQSIEVQKEAFIFNLKVTERKHESEILKYKSMMDLDNQIISLRKSIRETAAVQLEQGVVSSTDFIREVNAEDQAKQDRVLHEIQWLMAQALYQFNSGR